MIGLINIQYGVAGGELYVIEANPRASRTVPFVSKAIGVPLAKVACRLMLGERLADQDLPEPPAEPRQRQGGGAALRPLRRRRLGARPGDEEHRRGDGHRRRLPDRLRQGAGRGRACSLPTEGTVFITVTDTDKPAATQIAARFHDLGFEVIATGGTAQAISSMGVPVTRINKIGEGSPHVVDLIRERRCDLVINTPTGSGARADGYEIRTAAVRHGIPCVTTMTGASAAVRAIAAQMRGRAPRSAPCRRSTAPRRGPTQASMTAPFGRRLCEVTENRASGGYRVFSLLDAEGPEPRPGQFYMLATERHWEERGQRPFLPRAFSVADTDPAAGGVRLDFLIEGIGPGTDRLCALEPGERVWVNGPLGNAFSAPQRAVARRGRRDPRRRRHRHRAAGPAAPPALGRATSRPGSCSASATRPTPAASTTSSRCCEVGLASEDGHVGHHGYVTDLLAAMLDGDDAAQRRRLRLRPAADARGGARRSAPARGVACELAHGVADGLRLRRLLRLRGAASRTAATCASASTARSLDGGVAGPPSTQRGRGPRWTRSRCRRLLRDRAARTR